MKANHFSIDSIVVQSSVAKKRQSWKRAVVLAFLVGSVAVVPANGRAETALSCTVGGQNIEQVARMNSKNVIATFVQGNYAYIGNAGSLNIFDVSNPTSPVLVGTSTPMPDTYIFDIRVTGNYAYVANARGGLRILDVSNPQHPFEVGVYNTNQPNDANDWTLWGVDIRDNYAYVADMGSGLRIVDISNPAKPVEVSFISSHGLTHAVKLNGNFAYMVDWSGGLRIVDITNPKSPKEVGFSATQGLTYGVAFNKAGDLAYVADYNGLRIVDVSNPANPIDVGSYKTAGIATNIFASGNYVYVNNGGSLLILDVSNPQSPQLIESYSITNELGRLILSNDLLYVPNRDNGLLILRTGCSQAASTSACTEWNLAKDFRMSPNQENPNRDSCGNKDVWHFLQSGDMNRNPQTYTLMPNFSTNSRYDGTAGIHNWTGTEIPDVTVWKTEKDFIRSNDTQLSKYVYMHPGWNHLTIIGWRSPINGNVKINGEIASAYTQGGGGCGSLTGDGIKWYIDKGATNLVAGAFPNQGSQNLQEGTIGSTLANIPVAQGEFIYFAIDRNASAFCDATKFDVTISQVGGVSTEIVANPPAAICLGKSFDVTIRVNKTDTQPVDGAELALKFDKTKLKVNSMTNSGAFDTVLDSKYDNATGDITFSAGAWTKPAATSSFDLFTINFTALSTTAGTTLLDFVNDNITLTSGGQAVITTATDKTITLNQCLNYRVNLQRANAKGDPSWMTPLKVSLGTATNAVEYDTTCDVNGLGTIVLSKPVVAGDYLCVKNSHTLANKVAQPFSNPVNFNTLLEGDATNNNTVDIVDFSFATTHKGCKGAASTQYDPQADFNVSVCVDEADLTLLKSNYKKPSACKWNDSLKMYRKGEREIANGENTVTLGAIAPNSVKVGDSFDYTIQVNANETHPADGVALYLNFDPAQLRVEQVTTTAAFDVTLENAFDNQKGEINFAAGVWNNPALTTATNLVTIRFTALQAGEHTIAFNYSNDRETIITRSGSDVTGFSENGKIIVEPTTPPPSGDYTASGTLLGRTGIPLAGATIHVGDRTVVTDKNGHWSISGLSAGKHDIVATKEQQSCLDSEVELLGNGQYQQTVNYACDLITYGDDHASIIMIWQYVGSMSVEDFDAKYQEGRDYRFTGDEPGDFLLQGVDDQGKTTSFSTVKAK